MTVLAIGGSLREGSNTNKLVKIVAASCGVPFEYIDLREKQVKPCTGCMECVMEEGRCTIVDDDMAEINLKLMEATGVILGSPTYNLTISGAVKSLIDRVMANHYRGIGPIAHLDIVQFAPGLPKTRSGKIMRRILRKVANDELDTLGDTSTLAEPAVLDDLIANRTTPLSNSN